MTAITLSDIGCDELERDLRAALEKAGSGYARRDEENPSAEGVFESAMADVIHGIEARGRFQLLKRFIAHGSLLPSWDTKSGNSRNPLNDDELAACVDFITGHMITKFQGKLAELLAASPLADLVHDLKTAGRLPPDASLVLGDRIRCASRARHRRGQQGTDHAGVQGPDALVIRELPNDRLEILLVAEIKSMYVSPKDLQEQWDHHVGAVLNGVRIRERWFPGGGVCIPEGSSVIRVFVRSASWILAREFSVEKDAEGTGQIVMEDQGLPAGSTEIMATGPDEWRIRLAWSYEALRAAAFGLAHRYMREVGIALSEDPDEAIRRDMNPAEAGENDFMAQLHVAIARQSDVEPNRTRRERTIELYNVLGFGWALGHKYRDDEGKPAMLYYDDLLKRGLKGTVEEDGARDRDDLD